MAPDTETKQIDTGTALEVLEWAIDRYHPNIAVSCSFERPVAAHMALTINPDVRIFSIDTGRLPEETYECAYQFQKRFGARIEWYFPEREAVEKLETEKGLFSFRESVEARRECCRIRKTEPLARALSGMEAWITGRRREQAETRKNLEKVEDQSKQTGLVKINPLADWAVQDMQAYMREHNVPENKLLHQGYSSVGCACCTRAIQPGEDPRSGRWWWEQSNHKECGLHSRNWNI